MKKRSHIIGMLMVFLFVLVLLPAGKVSASQKTDAIKAYKKFLTQSTITWKETLQKKSVGKISTSKVKFTLAYINNDSVPELVIFQDVITASERNTGNTAIYRYKDGKVCHATTLCEMGKYYKKFPYYKKKGVVISNDYRSGSDLLHFLKYPYVISHNRLSYFIGKQISYRYNTTYYFNSSGNSIGASTFKSRLRNVVGSNYVTAASFHSNTAANRTNYLK